MNDFDDADDIALPDEEMSPASKAFLDVFLKSPELANEQLAGDIDAFLNARCDIALDDLGEAAYILDTLDEDYFGLYDYVDALDDYMNDPQSFASHKKADYFNEEITIETENGASFTLPAPSSFAEIPRLNGFEPTFDAIEEEELDTLEV